MHVYACQRTNCPYCGKHMYLRWTVRSLWHPPLVGLRLQVLQLAAGHHSPAAIKTGMDVTYGAQGVLDSSDADLLNLLLEPPENGAFALSTCVGSKQA